MVQESDQLCFRIVVGGARKTWAAFAEGLSNIADESALYFHTERRAEFEAVMQNDSPQGCIMYPEGHVAFMLSREPKVLVHNILDALENAHSDYTALRAARLRRKHKPFGVPVSMHLG